MADEKKAKSVVFYGHGLIYDPATKSIVAKFDKTGRLQTADPRLIERLKKDGFTIEPPKAHRAVEVPGSDKMRVIDLKIEYPNDSPVDADKQKNYKLKERKRPKDLDVNKKARV